MIRRLLPALALLLLAAPLAHAGQLQAGAGRADITPPTGYYMMGWVRADGKTTGQHTRLYARVLVLEKDGKKVALIAEDLNGIAGGMLKDAADLVKDRGFSEQNVLDSASHTHAAQTGYYNFGTFNTVFPTQQNVLGITNATDFNVAADPVLYTFMVKQLAEAIKRADDDRAPAVAAWGHTELKGLTENRSLEAHLADFGIVEPRGMGSVSQDPGGYDGTIDPNVDVLRVDKIAPAAKVKKKKRRKHRLRHKSRSSKRKKKHRKRRKQAAAQKTIPLGAWSNFADHGTVNKYEFNVYNADHHGSATRVFENDVREAGGSPAGQEVVNVYGNSDEGDMSAGLTRSGPAAADEVGRVEAAAMMDAWRQAGKHLTADPALDFRWTRVCYCGQQTEGGRVDTQSVIGLPQFTGSEEGRGPLYDLNGSIFEDDRSPVDDPVQGFKIPVVRDVQGSSPTAVPFMAVRIGDGMMVSIPGEMTMEMGKRVRAAVAGATTGAGINHVVLSGLANEYIDYFTTPEEYQRQHYEGGATVYGKYSSNVIKQTDADLAKRLATGQPAPEPYPSDPTNGLHPTAGGFDQGPSSGSIAAQPFEVRRLQRASFSWRGGPKGFDRPVDKPFVTIERLGARNRWERETDDLGLQVIWRVDAGGLYTAQWEVPLYVSPGSYRFVITANHYNLTSDEFRVLPARSIGISAARNGDTFTVTLAYPQPVINQDLTYRPPGPQGGTVTFDVGGKPVRVSRNSGTSSSFSVKAPPGTSVSVAADAARDRFGNTNGGALGAGAAQNADRARNRAAVAAARRAYPPDADESRMHGDSK